jgi:hypothetical protein
VAVAVENTGDARGDLDPIETLPGAERNLTKAIVKTAMARCYRGMRE